MPIDPRAVVAAKNNADIYEAVFVSHGLDFDRSDFAFSALSKPPPYYANLTILTPDRVEDCISKIKVVARQFDGAIGIKDSFCQLELVANGFEVLFTASWIWRSVEAQTEASTWQRVESDTELQAWESAWNSDGSPTPNRIFNTKMLAMPEVAFLVRKQNGKYLAGCIANISKDCVGISNVFCSSHQNDTYHEAAAAVAAVAPELPIVGYEAGEDLERACEAGFETVGGLRILVARSASF
jgi:hypothetical protein